MADTLLENLLPSLVFATGCVFCEVRIEEEDTSFTLRVRYGMRLKKQWSIDQYPFKLGVSILITIYYKQTPITKNSWWIANL
jgi:hypothetical protein